MRIINHYENESNILVEISLSQLLPEDSLLNDRFHWLLINKLHKTTQRLSLISIDAITRVFDEGSLVTLNHYTIIFNGDYYQKRLYILDEYFHIITEFILQLKIIKNIQNDML